jgi:hypothetical protein
VGTKIVPESHTPLGLDSDLQLEDTEYSGPRERRENNDG